MLLEFKFLIQITSVRAFKAISKIQSDCAKLVMKLATTVMAQITMNVLIAIIKPEF